MDLMIDDLVTIRLEEAARDPGRNNGRDLDVWGDVWGDDGTPPAVLIPRPGDVLPCPLKENGRCTCCPGQEVCLDFAEDLKRLPAAGTMQGDAECG